MTKGKKGKHKHLLMITAILAVVIIVSASVGAYIYTTQKSQALAVSNGGYAQFVINYAPVNGVTPAPTVINSNEPQSTIKQDALVMNGQTVASINSNLYVTPTFTVDTGDSVQSWSVTGTFAEQLNGPSTSGLGVLDQGPASQALQPVWTFSGQPPQPTWTAASSGQSFIVASSTLTAAQIQAIYSGWQQGKTYTITDTYSGSVTINFAIAGPQTQTVMGPSGTSISGTVTLTYNSASSFTGVTADFAYS